MEGLMPALLAREGRKSAFDDAGAEAQAAGRKPRLGLSQVDEQALLQAGQSVSRHDGELIAGGVQHVQSMGQAEAIRIQVGEASPIDASRRAQRSEKASDRRVPDRAVLATGLAQGLRAEPLMGFELINHQFDLPALMIAADEVEGGGLQGIKQGGDQPMHFPGIGPRALVRETGKRARS